MNQILFSKDSSKSKKDKIKVYKVILFFSIFIIGISAVFIAFFNFNKNRYKSMSTRISDNFETLKLYADNNNFDNFKNISGNITNSDHNINTIIGNISIPSLSLDLPFFSFLDDSYLSISPCRFFGNMPPSRGNLCIAGHNYDNDEFFSNLNKLKKDDQIIIYDNLDHQFLYLVYDIFEVYENDLSPIYNFDTSKSILTLVTCNNLNKNRLIVRCDMVSS